MARKPSEQEVAKAEAIRNRLNDRDNTEPWISIIAAALVEAGAGEREKALEEAERALRNYAAARDDSHGDLCADWIATLRATPPGTR